MFWVARVFVTIDVASLPKDGLLKFKVNRCSEIMLIYFQECKNNNITVWHLEHVKASNLDWSLNVTQNLSPISTEPYRIR